MTTMAQISTAKRAGSWPWLELITATRAPAPSCASTTMTISAAAAAPNTPKRRRITQTTPTAADADATAANNSDPRSPPSHPTHGAWAKNWAGPGCMIMTAVATELWLPTRGVGPANTSRLRSAR